MFCKAKGNLFPSKGNLNVTLSETLNKAINEILNKAVTVISYSSTFPVVERHAIYSVWQTLLLPLADGGCSHSVWGWPLVTFVPPVVAGFLEWSEDVLTRYSCWRWFT